MALMIKDNCELCDACIIDCPNEAITEGDPYIIDALRCTECIGEYDEPQCRMVCPVDDCIIANPDFQESEEELLEKYEMLHG
jgi:ferredoxin